MANIPARIEIPQFPGGKRIAVTTSWDDGRVYDHWVIEKFNEWGLKGTFNLNSAFLARNGKPNPVESAGCVDVCEVADLYAGHEVAIHTAHHPHLEWLDQTQVAAEVLEDRKALEDLVGYPVRGMAYPFGTYNTEVIQTLRGLGIVYSRTTANSLRCFPPEEPLAWSSTMHHIDEQPTPLPQRWETFYNNQRSNGVFYVWGHSYEFANAPENKSIDYLFKPLVGKPDVWYCTNIELFDYEAARKRMVIAANKRSAYNPSGIAVTLNVDGTLLDVQPGQFVTLG